MTTDLTSAKTIEIVISHDGKQIWINTENGMQFRAYRIENLVVDDRREPPLMVRGAPWERKNGEI